MATTEGDNLAVCAALFAAYPFGIASYFQATGQYLVDRISYHITDRIAVLREIGSPGLIFQQQGFNGGRDANQRRSLSGSE